MVDYQPSGWPSVIPRIFVADAEGLVGYLKAVFDATGDYTAERPAEMRIGDSIVMVSGDSERDAFAACLYVYVPDADTTCQRAIAAGATSLEAPFDTPYGDRRGMVRDPWGNVWQVATYRRER